MTECTSFDLIVAKQFELPVLIPAAIVTVVDDDEEDAEGEDDVAVGEEDNDDNWECFGCCNELHNVCVLKKERKKKKVEIWKKCRRRNKEETKCFEVFWFDFNCQLKVIEVNRIDCHTTGSKQNFNFKICFLLRKARK